MPLIEQQVEEAAAGGTDAMLRKVLEVLLRLDDHIRSQNETDNGQPWVMRLVMELNLGTDEDGNGMIFGRDFGLAENANHVPPSLQPMVGLMVQQGWTGRTLSWEQYLASLPEGTNRDAVSRYVASLPPRHVRPRDVSEETDGKQI